MTELIIADNTITEIAPSAFKDYKKLKTVEIGNSVTKIGASAFQGCNKIEKISFATPAGGYSSFPRENIGENAFSTGADKLIIQGDIDLIIHFFKVGECDPAETAFRNLPYSGRSSVYGNDSFKESDPGRSVRCFQQRMG